jgi:hypothetical protein
MEMDLTAERNRVEMELGRVDPQKAALIDLRMKGVQDNILALRQWGYNWKVEVDDSKEFAKWPMMVYHPNQEPKIVETQDELDKLGAGWGPLPGGAVEEVKKDAVKK